MLAPNTITPQENSQEMDAESAKASMGISSRLVEQLLGSQGQENPSEQPTQSNSDMMSMISDMMDKKLNTFKKELLTDLEDEEEQTSKNNSEA